MRSQYLLICFLMISIVVGLTGQNTNVDSRAIQFSGVVLSQDELGNPEPLAYTNISVAGSSRGTVSDINGFFSLVALESDTIVFSRIGFETIEITVPENLEENRYTWYQIMTQDNVLLPEAVIYPWPSREHFKYDLLAIDISDQLREQADQNIAKEVLDELRYTIPADGTETFQIEQAKQIYNYQYAGQYKPQNIFNPLAWKKFIDAWRRGDFKKKD